MRQIPIALATLFACVLILLPTASPAVDIIVRVETGQVDLFNRTGSSVNLAGYSIESTLGTLSAMGWDPIAGRLDASAGGGFDNISDWLILSAEGQSQDISEAALSGPGGALAANELLGIGLAWNPGSVQDLSATILTTQLVDSSIVSTASAAQVVFSPLGDYDLDGDVDNDDYAVFRDSFGSTVDLRADGNGDSVIDNADYTIWRDALAAAIATSTFSLVTAIPEPSSALLLATLLAFSGRGLRLGHSRRG